MVKTKEVDLVIIGAGPVGLFATFYARLRELNVVLIESLDITGGQPQNLYPQKQILDVPGWLGLDGTNLTSQLQAQMEQLQPEVYLGTTVTNVSNLTEAVLVKTDRQIDFKAAAVLVATGKGAFEPRRLTSDLEQNFENHGLYYFVQDLQQFKNQRVTVLGGGDSAVDLANQLSTIAKDVTIVHRRNNFRALEHALVTLAENKVHKMTPYTIQRIARQADQSFKLDLQTTRGHEERQLTTDAIIVSYGFQSENKIVEGWSIDPVMARQKMVVDQNMRTSVERVFAIGDAAEFEHKAELIVTGFGDAPVAINTIIDQYLQTHQGVLHSSSIKIKDGQLHIEK
ncbi:NAD(P)/FAD-dependent oxidoreductase [Weissella coleopterorum]|uniref:Ferredoxin--NADP reductase n=1 Tax=Weissella coleopterorum TaxID=2714949 RepID=A0A6G8AZ64_9LACO|nr:NAD(P)/FAD-dependent oxidoreductase [Weissella coleopterorum]QIL50277.1 NAD(P)/FAD-dependent oxidoreductase [Weissella coleopterorum]